MANVSLKFNPYTKNVVECSCDGDTIDVSKWGFDDRELGEWSSDFISKIVSKYNDRIYEIDFEGIERDVNFLEDSAKDYMKKNPKIKIKINGKASITPAQKFKDLKTIFDKMQKESPFPELRDSKLESLFKKAVSSEFELAVVATMSSGKSTLINAMIGRDLLPAKNEATTANLARIHDVDGKPDFDAKAYNTDDEEIESRENVNQKDLENLNNRGNDPKAKDFVSRIELYGDIQGIESSNLQLVMTDTPGPNNSQNAEHQEHTYSLFKEEYKPMILYVLNASQLSTNDDHSLLRKVAEAMAEGNRQSQDRFIFALNKADSFDPDKGEDLDGVIKRVNNYLESHGIHNAKIFPCDSLSAKVFRQYLNNQKLTEKEEDDIYPNHKKIVKREWRHFSDKAPLSLACKKQLNLMLDEADLDSDEERKSVKKALIYTGIPAIELAISEYLSKYALPAKLTKGVDSFKQKIISLKVEANANKAISENKDSIKKALNSLEKIETTVKKGLIGTEVAKDLENIDIQKAVLPKFNECRTEFMNQFRSKIAKFPNTAGISEAHNYKEQLVNHLKQLQASFKVDVEKTIENIANNIVKQNLKKLNDIVEGIIGECSFSIVPLGSLLGTATVSISTGFSEFEYSERVRVGSHMERNTNKKWYKPWTWFDDDEYEVDDYENVKKVNFRSFIDKKVSPEVEEFLISVRTITDKYISEEKDRIKTYLVTLMKDIETKLKEKIVEKQTILSDKEKMESTLKENEINLLWLKKFNEELDQILVI